MDARRILIAAAMALALGAVLAWLQGSFDRADLRQATALLETTSAAPGSPTLAQAIARRLGHRPDCDAVITQGCRGIVQVRCAGEPGEGAYLFDADLARRPPVLHPANPSAQALMADLFREAGRDGGELRVLRRDGG